MSKKKPSKPVMIKIEDELLSELDAWRERQGASPTRSEVIRTAIRRFIREEPPTRGLAH